MSDNPPRPFNLDDPAEVMRLVREVRGYLHTCHFKHGTDWEGRKHAIFALDRILDDPTLPTIGSIKPARPTTRIGS